MATKNDGKWPEAVPDDLLLRSIDFGCPSDSVLLRELNRLCREHGYGRVGQFADWIRQVWYDRDVADKLATECKKQRDFMDHCRREIERGDAKG